MHNPNFAQLQIIISAPDTTLEDIDRMTRQLLLELRELDIESAQLVKGDAVQAGAKGDPITIGSIAIELLPAVLPSVFGLVQTWASRRQGRTVRFKGKVGTEFIDFEGSPENLQKILDVLTKGKKK